MGDQFGGEKRMGMKGKKRKKKEMKERKKGKRKRGRERGRRPTGSSSVHRRYNCHNLSDQEQKLVYSTRATSTY